MALVREILFFPSCFWAAEYFTERGLDLWVTGARNRSGVAQHHVHASVFLPRASIAGLGAINPFVVSAAGTAVLAGVCGGNRLGRRNLKRDLVAFRALCCEQRTERPQVGFLFTRAVLSHSRALLLIQSPATNVSFPTLSSLPRSVLCPLPSPTWSFPFPDDLFHPLQPVCPPQCLLMARRHHCLAAEQLAQLAQACTGIRSGALW